MGKKTRKSYTRDEKLKGVAYYKEHTLYKNCKQFCINTKNVLYWARAEKLLKLSKRGSRYLLYSQVLIKFPL